MARWLPEELDPRKASTPVGEKATLVDYLKNYRLTLQLKCEGLSPEQLATRSVPPSTLSLLGLVRHLAFVEHHWFVRVAQGLDESPLFVNPDDSDWVFNGVVGTTECVDEAFDAFRSSVARAEAWLDGFEESEFGREFAMPRGGVVTARDLLVHMIEEYARHCGHADLIRECIDGRTGE